jgi:DNA-binding NtrC family response regulator
MPFAENKRGVISESIGTAYFANGRRAMFSDTTVLVLAAKMEGPDDIARALADQFRVIEVEDSEAGAVQISNGEVDAVVADLDSAKTNALKLLRRVKEDSPAAPILVVTDGGDVNAAVEAMKLGATDCLIKPVKPEDLQKAVSGLVKKTSATPPAGTNHLTHIDIPPGTSLEDLERAAVEQALAQHQGNRTHAAKTLGISVRTLQRKLKAWGIPMTATNPNSRSNNNFVLSSTSGAAGYNAHAHSVH